MKNWVRVRLRWFGYVKRGQLMYQWKIVSFFFFFKKSFNSLLIIALYYQTKILETLLVELTVIHMKNNKLIQVKWLKKTEKDKE